MSGERPAVTQQPGTVALQANTPKVAATASDELLVLRNNSGATMKVKRVTYSPDTAVAGHATANMVLQLKSKTAAGAAKANVTAAKTYIVAEAIAQFAESALVLSATATDLLVLDGESLVMEKTENSTGADMPAGIVAVEVQYV
jgi:hypothetical protein